MGADRKDPYMPKNKVDPALLTPELIVRLTSVDTPTICNALEAATGGRTNKGFTKQVFFAAYPQMKPVVGFARTATIRSAHPYVDPPATLKARRVSWYEHIAAKGLPVISVVQDIDEQPGVGAFWGEVHTNILKGLGVQGALTNGAMRDFGILAAEFQVLAGTVSPSHAFVQVVSVGGAVQIHGLDIEDGDLLHMDRHGAVVIEAEALPRLCDGMDIMARREGILLEAARSPGFSIDKLKAAINLVELIPNLPPAGSH
jgi:regulator of RNase E activity RraA